jgi:pimeloyl-ACP methyl ester carboxylesterase
VHVPTLVIVGGKSPTWMKRSMESLAQLLPNAQLATLAGQTHMVKPEPTAQALTPFFRGVRGEAQPLASGA